MNAPLEADDDRDGFTSEARILADELSNFALRPTLISAVPCGHGDAYELNPGAPLPTWFHEAMSGATLTAAEGPWPNWGRVNAPIDWPTLMRDHPDYLAFDSELLDDGCSWESIAKAFTIAREIDPATTLDTFLWVSEDAKILIEPWFIITSSCLPEFAADRISKALIAGGRHHDRLHCDKEDERRQWMPNS